MRRLLTPRWVACHVLMVVLTIGMLGLAGWQLARATSGNMLSWGYTLQWPVFAGFVVFIWAREVRRALRRGADTLAVAANSAAPHAPAPAAPAPARRPVITRRAVPAHHDTDDPDLATYNRYLRWLNANPGARPADFPG
jgi:DNA-binding transcriptional regulator of glucitol operon